jgi:hypothetical protein
MNELIRGCALALLLALAGCAAVPGREVQTPRDQVIGLKAALAAMSDDDAAAAARVEIERARTCLAEADSAVAKDEEADKIALLIDLSRGQLLLVKSILERRKAEVALAQKSEEYKKQSEAIETIERKQKAIGPTPEEER